MASPPNKPARLHHYVPQFYLKRFADQTGKVSVYDRTDSRVFSTLPTVIAAENNFYQLPEETGLPPTYFEDMLAIQEGEAATAIGRTVLSGRAAQEDRLTLAMHLALQVLRTRHTRDVTLEMSRWSGTLLAQIELRRRIEGGEFPQLAQREEAERALRLLEEGKLYVEPMEIAATGIALKSFPDIVARLMDRWNWIVVVLPRARFLSSDRPIAYLGEPEPGRPGTNVGVANALEIWFPMDAEHALALTRDQSVISPILGLPDAHVRRSTPVSLSKATDGSSSSQVLMRLRTLKSRSKVRNGLRRHLATAIAVTERPAN